MWPDKTTLSIRVVTILDDDLLSEIFLDEILSRVEQGSTVRFLSKVGVWKVIHYNIFLYNPFSLILMNVKLVRQRENFVPLNNLTMKCFPPRSHRSRVRRQKLSIPLPAINSRTKSKVTKHWSLDTLCDVRGREGGGKGLKKPWCRYLEQLSISSQSEEREIPHKPMRIKVKISWLLKARENWTRVTKSQLVLVLNLID